MHNTYPVCVIHEVVETSLLDDVDEELLEGLDRSFGWVVIATRNDQTPSTLTISTSPARHLRRYLLNHLLLQAILRIPLPPRHPFLPESDGRGEVVALVGEDLSEDAWVVVQRMGRMLELDASSELL